MSTSPILLGPYDATNTMYTPPTSGSSPVAIAELLQDLYNLRATGAALQATATVGSYNTTTGIPSSVSQLSGTDDLAYLQALVNQAGVWNPALGPAGDWDYGYGYNNNNLAQGIARLPPGVVFAIDGTLTVPPGVRIEGNNCTILQLSTAKIPTILINNPGPGTTVNGGTINFTGMTHNDVWDLTIWGGAAQVNATGDGLLSGQQGVGIVYANQCSTIKRCLISGFRVGIDVWSSQYFNILDCQVEGNVHNIILRNAPGGSAPVIDAKIGGNSRFSKAVGGYGIWAQQTANLTIDQVDTNYSGKCALVAGGALPVYLSRILPISNPGSGYTPGTFPYLSISDGGNNPTLTGFVEIGPNGTVVDAYVTNGLGNGKGINTSALTISVVGQSPTTPATFNPTIVNDAASFSDLMTTPGGITLGGAVKIENFKSEVTSSPGPYQIKGAPDCGFVIFGDVNSQIRVNIASISNYARGANNYYKWAYLLGYSDITVESISGSDTGLANPGLAGDYALFVVSGNAVRIHLPHNAPVSNFVGIVAYNTTSAPAVTGGELFLEATSGDARYMPGIVLNNNAYVGNPRIQIRQGTDTTNRWQANGDGYLCWGPGGSANVDTFLYRPNSGGSLSTPNVFQAAGYSIAAYVYNASNAFGGAINGSNGLLQYINLYTNFAGVTVINPVAGATLKLVFVQDATGSRTVTWGTAIKWQGGTAPTLTTAAGKKDVIELFFDGTDLLGSYKLNF